MFLQADKENHIVNYRKLFLLIETTKDPLTKVAREIYTEPDLGPVGKFGKFKTMFLFSIFIIHNSLDLRNFKQHTCISECIVCIYQGLLKTRR